MRSDLIDFGRPVLWGELRWLLLSAPGSRITMSTRIGEDTELLRFWKYTGIGDQRLEVSREEYRALRTSEKAGTTYNYSGWSLWSADYDMAGGAGSLPPLRHPRRALQFRLEYLSTGLEASQLGYLEVRASDPIVTEVLGELSPVQARPGEVTGFTYTFRPRMAGKDTGFDRLEIRTVAAQLETAHSVTVDGFDVPFSVELLDEGRLVVGFSRVSRDYSDALVRVSFGARVLRHGAAFAGFLRDSDRPYEVAQPILAGDASSEVLSDRVWIETSVVVKSVLATRASPTLFTPNDDGFNDVTRISYELVEITGSVQVAVVIHDLAGRQVRSLHRADEDLGHYERVWDGRDDAGSLVPPGIYVYRVATDVGGEPFVRLGPLHVVY